MSFAPNATYQLGNQSPVMPIVGEHVGSFHAMADTQLLNRAGISLTASAMNRDLRYRCLFDNNLDAVFSLDPSGQFTEANPAAQRLCGYSQQELQQLHFADACVLGDRARAMFFFARAIAGRPRSIELTALRHDGSKVDLLVTGAPILAEGRVMGLFCIARDVTRKRRAERRLRKARRDAEHAKDRFLAVVSHELRTPLMPVLTTVQMLERRPDLPSDLHDNLAMMRRNLELEAKLIDDLLDLNRLRQGKLTLYFQDIDLHARIRHVVDLCHQDLTDKHLNLTLDLAAPRSGISADPARVQQMLWNLLGNAIKHTPGHGHITVRTCLCQHDQPACDRGRCPASADCARWASAGRGSPHIAVHVTDSGVGITADAIDRLFDAFDGQTHDHCHKGAGLAIAHALAELHSGALLAHSAGRSKGSTFTLILPLPAAPQHTADQGKAASPASANPSATRRVLLVEDHADTARAMARLLGDAGLAVTVAGSVQAACATADRQEFDLLVSDIGLPDGNGIDVVRHLRRNQPIPAIALSGYGMEDDIRRSHEAGFCEHLVKPINISHLLQTIQRLLAVN